MIAQSSPASSSGLGLSARGCAEARRWVVTLGVADAPRARPAARPQPRQVAGGLDGLLTDDAPVRPFAPALYAARAFSAGDGFLPGQMIDRSI